MGEGKNNLNSFYTLDFTLPFICHEPGIILVSVT